MGRSVLFETWLQSVRARQQDEGVDRRELATYASKLTPYVKDKLFAAMRTMESLYIRTPPEPLGDADQREMWLELREDYIREIRKTLELIGEALTVVGCTDEELGSALQVDEMPEDPGDDPDDESESEGVDGESDVEATVKIPVLADVLVREKKEEK